MSKKIVAMLMAVAMAFSLLPVTALAGNTSPLSITPPNEGKFATYEFYISETAESPWYTQTVKTGDTLKPPADPTLAGSHFTGWKTADGKEVPFGTVTVEKASTIQCYAQWAENKNPIHVYFMAETGSNEVMHTGVAQNGIVAIPEDYKDITWKTADGSAFTGTGVTNDINVYPASASCWLTFDSQGGSAIASHYVQQGESFELGKVGNPEKAGYTFAGWSLTTDGEIVEQVTPNGDTKLYALWTPARANYTVIHWQENANDTGYSYIESETKSGTTEDQTNAAAKSYQGFTATGIEQQTIKGDDSTIVNVFYKRNIYEISFWYYKQSGWFGGEWKEYTNIRITAKYGAYIGNQWPTIDGSSAWKTSKHGSISQVNIDTMPLNGATFYGPETGMGSESAHYYVQVLPGESGTVTQGGVTYKLHHTDTSPGTGATVTKEDKYELTGFTYKEGTNNGNRYNNANFYYIRNSYDVVYISNGVEVKTEPYKYEQDIRGAGSYEPDNAPTGYRFDGWCSDPSGTRQYDFSGKTMPAQNITVYAKWVPITLTLTIEGVEGVTNGTVNYNQVINGASVYTDATAKLAAENKTVLYWVNCETNQKEDVNRQMTTNLTIRPVLKGDTYTVTYGGGATDSQLYWYNTIAKVKNYTGDNAGKFLYWTDTANNNKKYHPGDEIQMTANVTLKPKFSGENPGQTYSVTYHSNFGTGQEYTPEESIENNALFTIKTYEDTHLPNQEGYEFKEWNTKSDGTGEKFEAGSSARMDGANGNDLYAQWQQSTYTLTIIKKVVGDRLTVDRLPENFQITVKDAQDNIKGTLTKTEEAKKADDTLTWTISGLPAGEYTVSESNAGVDGYTCTATYNNGTANSETVTVERNKTSTMTVTNTYTKNATVTLSQLIQKQLTLKDVSTLPDNTTFTVTVKPEKVNDKTVEKPKSISGSVTVSALKSGTQNGDTYTAPFIFDNDGTLSLPAGTYTYTVQETEGDVSGMQYDSEKYTLTIKVENSKASVQYTTKEGATSEVSTTKPLTIKNTYQAPDLSVTKEPYKVNGIEFKPGETVAHVNDQIIWKVNVTNNKTTPASTQLKDTLGGVAVYSDKDLKNLVNLDTDGTWTARVPANDTVTYYVTYKVQAADIPNGKIVNAIVKDGENNKPSDPVSTWDTKQLKSATSLNSDWTTTVTLTLPTVNGNKEGTPETEVQPDPITAISKGSYVIDKIGKQFTFMDGLSLKKNNAEIPKKKIGDTYYFGENATEQSYLYKLTYTAQNGEEAAQFKWEINENIPAETTVTLSYNLELTTREKNPGTYGKDDLDGSLRIPESEARYTNESAILCDKENTKLAEFPKPSVSYTIKSSSGSHSGGSRPSLNTKDHYGYIIGYPVDYYTGQPTTDQTKKPVRPEGKITRAEVATIYFRMLTDESRTKFWSQSSGYSDVKAGDWFNNAVSTLSKAGIIAGYEDGSFRPNGYITRAEFATIAARFFDVTYNGKDLFPDISGHWAKDYINQAANKGFVNGYEDGTFKPDRNITRAEAVTLVNRTLDRHPDKSHFTKDMLVWPDNMDQTKWYYADMQEATNSHTYQMKENSDKTKYENWTKTLPIRNWEALEKAWSNANSSQGNGNVV